MILSEVNPPAARTHTIQRTIGHINVSVTSERNEILDDFAGLYRGHDRPDAEVGHTIAMEVEEARRSRLGRRRYILHGDGEVLGKDRGSEEILPFLEWGINWRVIARCTEYLQVHSATMAHGGKGVMLAGTSGCGKSTLSAGLLQRGWRYMCDELALIRPTTLRLHPFPKGLCIKAGSFRLMESLGIPFSGRRHYVKGLKGRVAYINPFDVRPDPVADPSPVRLVVFPKYVRGVQPRLRAVPKGRAVFMLASGALNRDAFRERTTSILGALVRGADCYMLESGTLEASCELLEEALSGTPDCL